jgi:hypothetical protein
VIVEFKTGSPFRALCDFGALPSGLRGGDRISVIAEGAGAERQPSAVLLHGCVVPSVP